MALSWKSLCVASLSTVLLSASSVLSWTDTQWQWAGSEFGITIYLKTINGCTDATNSTVKIKVVNEKDYDQEAEFRVTNAYWSKHVNVDLKSNATDSSLSLKPEDRTCRPLVDQIVARPKEQTVARAEF